jgi:parvulin-like peptidyl-prolyl isomerase
LNKSAVGIVIGLSLLAGCKGNPPAVNSDHSPSDSAGALNPRSQSPTTDPAVAEVSGLTVTESQLRQPLVKAYGLNILLNLVQLELAQREAQRAGVTLTDADYAAERTETIDRLFASMNAPELDKIQTLRATDPAEADKQLAALRKDNESRLDQPLAQLGTTAAELEIVIKVNATLRKIAEPQVEKAITDEKLQEAFRIQYGEKAVVRHIQSNNLAGLDEARRRLAAGEPFAKVAKELSTNHITAAVGGELPAFTRNNTTFPQSFRDTAFSLKVGEVSDTVQADGAYHLIKLEQLIEPKIVKFEDVKESVRADLERRLLEVAVRNLRRELAQEALTKLTILDPVLKKQFDDKLQEQQAQMKSGQEVREELKRQDEAALAEQAREKAPTTRAATGAATEPMTPEPIATEPITTKPITTEPTTTEPNAAGPATAKPSTDSSATRQSGTFIDGILPSTMPPTMPSVIPGDAPSHPATGPATPTQPAAHR